MQPRQAPLSQRGCCGEPWFPRAPPVWAQPCPRPSPCVRGAACQGVLAWGSRVSAGAGRGAASPPWVAREPCRPQAAPRGHRLPVRQQAGSWWSRGRRDRVGDTCPPRVAWLERDRCAQFPFLLQTPPGFRMHFKGWGNSPSAELLPCPPLLSLSSPSHGPRPAVSHQLEAEWQWLGTCRARGQPESS